MISDVSTATVESRIRQWNKNVFKILKENHFHLKFLNASKFHQSLNHRCGQNKYFQTSSQKKITSAKLQEDLMKQKAPEKERDAMREVSG